ncbi:hypothetical protein [Streptomyces sp. NPDC001893]|uniref:hypothetical protein n=1 Tax=Streptomyces sp. NPDC001893 TaxID=3154530 RepID=UPI0033205A84
MAERARTGWPRPGPAGCPGLGLSQIEVRVQHARDLGEPVGAFLAFAALPQTSFDLDGVGLYMLTGDIAYEARASLLIGALLVFVAFQLASRSHDQLIGEAADPVLRSEIHEFLDEQGEIDTVSTPLTMRLGTRSTHRTRHDHQ